MIVSIRDNHSRSRYVLISGKWLVRHSDTLKGKYMEYRKSYKTQLVVKVLLILNVIDTACSRVSIVTELIIQIIQVASFIEQELSY